MSVQSRKSPPRTDVSLEDMDEEPVQFERRTCALRRQSQIRRGSKYRRRSQEKETWDPSQQESRNVTAGDIENDFEGRIVFESDEDNCSIECCSTTDSPVTLLHTFNDIDQVHAGYINEAIEVEELSVAEGVGHLQNSSDKWEDDSDWFSVLDDLPASITDRSKSAQELASELDLDPNDELLQHIEAFIRDNPGMAGLLELFQNLREVETPEEPKIIGNCDICYSADVVLRPTNCCKFPTCGQCLDEYLKSKISEGVIRIGCPSSTCNQILHRDEIRRDLDEEMKSKYDRFLVDANKDPHRKTCPRCSHITQVEPESLSERRVKKHGLSVTCSECQLDWCFPCQAPWHHDLTCKQFQAGDKLLQKWAKARPLGEANAQRCPKCKVFIQRSEGCDHMQCSRCDTKFCYRCGERRFNMKLKPFDIHLEGHDKKYSILGCKEIYKSKKPVKRAFTRGAIFGGKVVGSVVLGPVAVGLVAGVVGLAAGIAVVGLPFYLVYKLVRHVRKQSHDN